ncbi:hypothetical protein [Microbacterium sp. NPDC086615]|uniref:NucA/NucB deoxyribonuclease domain-containing protein n=1 Tax=Microbacterium sp. NPDC086615 TaxID=3154865 RepID=UPI003449E76B
MILGIARRQVVLASLSACVVSLGALTLIPPSAANASAASAVDEQAAVQPIDPALTPEFTTSPVLISYWDGDEADLTAEQKDELDSAGVELDSQVTEKPTSEISEELLDEAGTCVIGLGEDAVGALKECAAQNNVEGLRSSADAARSEATAESGDDIADDEVDASTAVEALVAEAPPTTSPCLKMQWEVKYVSRAEACIANSHIVYVVSNSTGQVVGNFLLEVATHTVTQKSLVMEATNYTWLRATNATGYAAGRTISANGVYGCNTAGCTNGPASFATSLNGSWKKAQGSSKFTFGPSATPRPLSENWVFTLTIPGSNPVKIQGLALKPRCDNNAISGLGQGCVYPQYISTVRIPSSGVTAAAGQHIAKALASGLPNTLSRTSPTQAVKNRQSSCAFIVSLPREENYECDEYPFASTQQGGSKDRRIFQGCRWNPVTKTGPAGVSVCLIPKDDNKKAGDLLNSFYRQARILEGDVFKVRVS